MGVPKTVAMPAASTCCMIVPGMIIMRIMGVVMIFRAACMRVGVCICCVIMPCGAGACMAVPVCLARRMVRMTTGRTRRLGRWRMIVRRRHGKAHS